MAERNILELYVSTYLIDNVDHLGIQEKKNLRCTCRSLKAMFDATLTDAKTKDGKTEITSDCRLIRFENVIFDIWSERQRRTPASFTSLDLLCRTFPNLKTLDVPNLALNQFTYGLPASIGKLSPFLTQLELAVSPEIIPIALPTYFSQMTALQILSVKPAMGTIPMLQHCTNLKKLELTLRTTPTTPKIYDFVGNSISLTRVMLHVDGACLLPESIVNLKKLKELKLLLTSLDHLPECLGNLCALQTLSLYRCKGLKRLPESLGNCTALEHLSIHKSRELESLPDSFCNLTNLKSLDLDSCRGISEIPSDISNFQSLERLYIERCHGLRWLPNSLGDLKSLEHLRINSCRGLIYLPETLTRLNTSLKSFELWECYWLDDYEVDAILKEFLEKVVDYREQCTLHGRANYDSATQSDAPSVQSDKWDEYSDGYSDGY
jgi:hypothetical protein